MFTMFPEVMHQARSRVLFFQASIQSEESPLLAVKKDAGCLKFWSGFTFKTQNEFKIICSACTRPSSSSPACLATSISSEVSYTMKTQVLPQSHITL